MLGKLIGTQFVRNINGSNQTATATATASTLTII